MPDPILLYWHNDTCRHTWICILIYTAAVLHNLYPTGLLAFINQPVVQACGLCAVHVLCLCLCVPCCAMLCCQVLDPLTLPAEQLDTVGPDIEDVLMNTLQGR